MSNKFASEVFDKLTPSKGVEDHQFQLLENIYKLVYKDYSYKTPVNGEVARQEHILKPFEIISELSGIAQDTLGTLTVQAEELDVDIRNAVYNVTEYMNYLRSEINTWKLQQMPDDNDLVEFYEEFAPGQTLPYDNSESNIKELSSIQFKPNRAKAGHGDKLPYYF